MAIISGYHPDLPSGMFKTTADSTGIHLETRAYGGKLEDGTRLWTEHDVINIPTDELLDVADLLIQHNRELRARASEPTA